MMSDNVTPFFIQIPEADPRDLRERLVHARWPEVETVTDGHFAAFEQPELFVNEVRSFFRLVAEARTHDR